MSGLGAESKTLLEATRGADEPTTADRERVRAALASRLALAAGTGLGAAAAARSSSSAPISAGFAAKALVTVGLVSAIGASAVMVVRTRPQLAAPTTSVFAPKAPASNDDPAHVVDGLNGAAPPRSPVPTSSRARGVGLPNARNPAATTVDVAAEVRVLSEAHDAMRAGHAKRALSLLDEHESRFPNGSLGEERDAARIVALCTLGRTAEAREATDRFLSATPRSPQAGAIRASCGGSSVGAPASSP